MVRLILARIADTVGRLPNMSDITIVVLVGSLRAASMNRHLAE